MKKNVILAGCILSALSLNAAAIPNYKVVAAGGDNKTIFKSVTLNTRGYCADDFLSEAQSSHGFKKYTHEQTRWQDLCFGASPTECSAARVRRFPLHDRYVDLDSTSMISTLTDIPYELFDPVLYCDVDAFVDYSNSQREVVWDAIRLEGQGECLPSAQLEEFSSYIRSEDLSGGRVDSIINFYVVDGAATDVGLQLEYLNDSGEWIRLKEEYSSLSSTSRSVDSITFSPNWISYPTITGSEPAQHSFHRLHVEWRLPTPSLVKVSLIQRTSSTIDLYDMTVDLEECLPNLAGPGGELCQ